ncbi:hypothetical protein [Streptomyces sp. NBC_00076]|uniref:hypothetical protein n=1 Tax=Streptomyces sp. NBC_00076 TaxID=2975642 RepID=UPI003247F7B8
MALLAVMIPLLMLGVMLALGRYEEVLLPGDEADQYEPAAAPPAVPSVGRGKRVQSAGR